MAVFLFALKKCVLEFPTIKKNMLCRSFANAVRHMVKRHLDRKCCSGVLLLDHLLIINKHGSFEVLGYPTDNI